jgi:L,D-transpeptidase YcbB
MMSSPVASVQSALRRSAVAWLLIGLAGSGGAPAPVVSAAAAAARQAARASAVDPEVVALVDRVLAAAEHPGLTWSAIPDAVPLLKPLYEAESDRLLWFEGHDPVPGVERGLAALGAAGDHGLNPADYDAAPLGQQWAAIKAGSASAPERALFDLGLSVAAARLIRSVHMGRVDPRTMQWGYTVVPKTIDVAAVVKEVREGKGLGAMVDALQPPFAHYARARKALAAYQSMARAGEPPLVPALPKGQRKVEPGATWDGVPQLATRLGALGVLAGGSLGAVAGGTVYSPPLVQAVKRFQERHGLEADGVIGPGTLKALNVPLAQRVTQIELAMERMRWLPDLGDRPNLFVNVPLFRMWATDPRGGEEPLRMNVVVGQSLNHQTPLFVEQLEYVIFRPYWNPPYGITVKEIVPKARRDPGYMARENLEIVASGADNAVALEPTPENLSQVVAGKLSIRQKPGEKNSLGLAKFIFPNAEAIYMHGTPAQQLFSRARRDFSHGCIRLEDPARLGEWVLRDQPEWTRARIDAAMKGDRPTRVNLKQPITVVLFYDTVHVNSEGEVFFAEDIYGHDRTLGAALEQGYPYLTKG